MAKFAKTTEIDISAMHEVVEEQAPKRNKWLTIIPIVLSIVIAFGLWIFVTEKSTDENSTSAVVTVESTGEELRIIASGTNSSLADFDKEDITVTVNDNVYTITYAQGTLQQQKKVIDGKTFVFFTVSGIALSIES